MRPLTSILFMVAISILAAQPNFAQKKEKKPDPKHTNHFKDVEDPIETDEVVIEFSNAVARTDFLKFKARFTNNTGDFLLIDASKFVVDVNGVELNPSEKPFILNPNGKKSKTIDVKEGADLHVDEFEVTVPGFERITTDGEIQQMADFQLPASANTISAGNFEINLKRLKQETKETWARFEVRYKGDDHAIIDPSRISVRIESGRQYANDDRKSKLILMKKGDRKTVNAVFHIPAKVVDMQFATLMIQWGETLMETKAVPFEVDERVLFELDEKLTLEKN